MAQDTDKLPAEVARHLGHYVYLYIDPRTEQPFYVGKGQGNRMFAHLDAEGKSRKVQILSELRAANLQPRLDVLAHGLKDADTALRIEAAVIDLLGLEQLTNAVRGWKSVQLGRMSLDELRFYYEAQPVCVTHPSLLIRINKLYRHRMSAEELYEATRGTWKLGQRREKARLALAVFEGVVREVYEIEQWFPAGTLSYTTRTVTLPSRRWEFQGRPAPTSVREAYFGRSVRSYFRLGQRSPVAYVKC